MVPTPLVSLLRKHQHDFYKVVDFDADREHILHLDLTSGNTALSPRLLSDTSLFASYINSCLMERKCRYAIGGYGELREMYARSALFDGREYKGDSRNDKEPRRLHLGIDIWGEVGTPVYAFTGGMVHSFAFNDAFGDYGATLILCHQLEGVPFYTLYGHIQLADISSITAGQYVNRAQLIAHFGNTQENGQWPPHLHFQVIADLEGMEGDYPGVCKLSEKEKYLFNCPDPDLILQLNRFL